MNVNHFLLISRQDKHMVEWQNHLIWCKKTLMLHAAANVGVVLYKSNRGTPCASVSWLKNECSFSKEHINISKKVHAMQSCGGNCREKKIVAYKGGGIF